MPELITSAVAICGGDYIYRRRVGECFGLCGIKDSAIVVSQGNPYYPSTHHCTNCGDTWSGEGLGYRPFARGWRQKAIAKALKDWERACECPVKRDDDLYPIPCEHAKVAA